MNSSTALYNQLKEAQPFFVLAGPNVIESEQHILHMAKQIKFVTSKSDSSYHYQQISILCPLCDDQFSRKS
ncbi:hypothetical protein L1887_30171 [Cichorium endivia]|nr:hypothetical protein L1887_30171 [Cichorium endivia]